MKSQAILVSILIVVFALFSNNLKAQQHRNCGTMEYLQHQIQQDSTIVQRLVDQEAAITNWKKNAHQEKSIIRIPVVFHVIWSMNVHNISDAQVYSQLDVLSADYRRFNTDTANTPNDFDSLAADMEIEFCIAHQDPNGNWTDGITRTQSNKSAFDMSSDEAKFTSTGGHDAWDANYYLNIWVVPAIVENGMGGILGYAQFPGGNNATDGVVIGYKYLGTMGAATAPFNLGRTATHEVGHWLSLYHIWGDDNGGCWGTDYVDDTPNQANYNYDCPTHPHTSCSNSGDMFMNYMDYTDDHCMNMFTFGQKARMQAIMNTSRLSLKTSGRCQANAIGKTKEQIKFNLYPSPASDIVKLEWNFITNEKFLEVRILDLSGRVIESMHIPTANNTAEINIANFKSGLYIIQIQNSAQIGYKKLLIQH